MATRRPTPLDDPPSASSDDDETEDEQPQQNVTYQSSSSSEEEEEEDSEEETIDDVKNPHEKPQIQSPKAESSSEGQSDSESEEGAPPPVTSIKKPKTLTLNSSSVHDIDSDVKSPTASDFAIKPSKKIVNETPEKAVSSKRPSSETDVKEKKKIKVLNGDVDDEKKASAKRVWSDNDELLLLQGFIEYQTKKGCSPLSDMDGFYQFTMDSLPGNATRSQLYEKIRRLKKKFLVISEKASGNGEDPVFGKPHELKMFELSKKIWGTGGCESAIGVGPNAKIKIRHSKPKPKIEVKEEQEEEHEQEQEDVDADDVKLGKLDDFETVYPHWSAALRSEVSSSLKYPAGVISLIQQNLSSIGEAKAKEMDEQWEAFYKEEAVLRKRKILLLAHTAQLDSKSVGE